MLTEHPCVRLRFPNVRYREWEFVQGGESFEVKVDGHFIPDNMSVLAQAAAEGVGFAYLLEQVVAPMLADGRLVKVLEDRCPARFALLPLLPDSAPATGGAQGFRGHAA
ncbi:MAG TPA: LysR substrate-binding domain-containing protein [Burkholderiaceae bacterium]|nr:LysR substrate-binding domain-containing protein [Burkholderiaceae bacterium]